MDSKSTMRTSQRGSGTRAIDRCLDLLDLVADQPVTLSQACGLSGLPRPTVIRLLRVLNDRRLIARDTAGVYRLGPRLAELAGDWRDQLGLGRVLEPHLEDLVSRYDETAQVSIRDRLTSVCVASVESRRTIKISQRLGAHNVHLHAGAFNKTLLAFAPEHVVDAVVDRGLPRLTSQTITDPDTLRLELERIRTQGFGESDGEVDEGIFSVAAPIQGALFADLVAVIGISAPDSRAPSDMRRAMRNDVVERAMAISQTLGGSRTDRD